MSGVDLTTISPSSTSSSRRTPCVEGCCGPIEIVICVSSGRSTISNCGGIEAISDFGFRISDSKTNSFHVRVQIAIAPINPQFAIRNPQSLKAIWLVPSQRKILSQRITLPVVRQENATQIGVPIEDYAKQIIGLALVPVGSAPNT